MSGEPFYITTAISYPNGRPHIGHAYEAIAADAIARFHRLSGRDVKLVTGTDEHGLKMVQTAQREGLSTRELADRNSQRFRELAAALGISNDDFIRTTEARHKRGAQEIWSKIEKNGDIYLGHYEGLYCVGCEAYYTEKDLQQPGNICPQHGKPVETVKEESYFFRLSRYADRLLEHYSKNPDFVRPESRLNEVTSFVQAGLQDLSVSRTTFQWGIPVPTDPRHVMYVWFDALSNYLTSLKAPDDNLRFWPSAVHLVGKDILRQHAVYWPAFLMSAGEPLPQQVFAHGFMTYNGRKMGKTLRNTISPVALAEALSPELDAQDTERLARLVGAIGDSLRGLHGQKERLVELRLDSVDGFEVGQEINVDLLASGEKVDVTAVSRGKGFAGGMKRHNFAGQGASHGNHKHHRAPGSIGSCSFPGRVFKGLRMAGHMGAAQTTVRNLEVLARNDDEGVIFVAGSVPGPRGGLVRVRSARKVSK